MHQGREKTGAVEASVILVSYNNLRATTVPCLESIFEKTSGDYEVICVDNFSTDGTREYLKAASLKETRLKPILNETNRGFSGGNNDGIRAARGKYIILLNNDTVVSRGWLKGLTAVLERDMQIGLVGPVSNAVGNEQRIDIASEGLAEILEEGRRWSTMSRGGIFETDMLSFFCVATRRDVIERVGLLDEAFGPGYYEDDAYCIRTRKAGYRLVCAEDVFVYHSGGGSFSKGSSQNLISNNKKLLEDKLGVAYQPRHWRRKLIDIIEGDLDRAREMGLTPGLRYKLENRLQLLTKNKPKNLLKKTAFNWRMQKLKRAIAILS